MSERTGIAWTDHTFNIAWGCMKVSPGCVHCYADTFSHRLGLKIWGPAATTDRRVFGEKHWREPIRWNKKAEREHVRRRVFCSSMCDVFEDHPAIDAEREKLWPLIRATPWLDWQLLTKRPERIAPHLPNDWGEGYPNVWLGTSVESQQYANERIPALVQTPARIRFLSCEPLLGPIDFEEAGSLGPEVGDPFAFSALAGADGVDPPIPGIDWLIVGGESGPNARPMEIAWVRSIRDACLRHGVALFVKQLGGHPNKRDHEQARLDGALWTEMPGDAAVPL
jgi:protein gp37